MRLRPTDSLAAAAPVERRLRSVIATTSTTKMMSSALATSEGLMRWGVVRSWAKDLKSSYKMINARIKRERSYRMWAEIRRGGGCWSGLRCRSRPALASATPLRAAC